jgi:DNA-binding transcriptional MerR regulator
MSGSHRRFKEDDIERLKYIKKLLREEGYSINQVIEFAGQDKVKAETQIEKREPLAMQALATAVAIEVGSQLEEYKLMIREELKEEIRNNFKAQEILQENNKEELKDYIAVAIQEQLGKISEHLDSREIEAKKRDEEKMDLLKKNMEEREKLAQELEKEKSKGFFGRLFGK